MISLRKSRLVSYLDVELILAADDDLSSEENGQFRAYGRGRTFIWSVDW